MESLGAEHRRIGEMDRRERRRLAIRTLASVLLVWVAVIGAFYVVPVGHESGIRTLSRLCIDIALIIVVLALQVRGILRADFPTLRAVQALGTIIPLFLVAFATIYLSLSHSSSSEFSQPLDHTRALYFTITVFSTVGFGDITPRTDLARILVSIQMILDLVIIGAVVRILMYAARTGIARRAGASGDSP